MSSGELVNLLSGNAVFATGLVTVVVGAIVVFAVGLLLWRGIRRIEARLDTLRAEVSTLSAVEQRNFLIALRSSSETGKANEAEPSIVPEIADLQSNGLNSRGLLQGMITPDTELVRQLAGTGEYRADIRSPNWFGYAIAKHLHIAVDHGADNDPKILAWLQRTIKTWLKDRTLATDERKDDVGRDRKFIVPGERAPSSGAQRPVIKI
jgi:hypothetical protein